MHIEFESSGGYANLTLAYRANTDELPPDVAGNLLRLIESSRVFELQQNDIASSKSGPPDVLFYKLTLHEGNKEKSLSFNDITAPKELRPLLSLLQDLAWDQASKK
jgi:Emfourin